jgi:hypothetical protein
MILTSGLAAERIQLKMRQMQARDNVLGAIIGAASSHDYIQVTIEVIVGGREGDKGAQGVSALYTLQIA